MSVEDVTLLSDLERQLPTDKSLPILHSHSIDVKLSNWKYFQEIYVGKEIKTFHSIDTGPLSVELDGLVSAPNILKSIVDCPVVLLKNNSENLRDDSTGTAMGFGDTGYPIVKLKDCLATIKEQKILSSVIHKKRHPCTQ